MRVLNSARWCVPLLAAVLASSVAAAQTSPFAIRRPPDGSVVREKVKVELPRAAIATGSFVGFYVDNNFIVALSANPESKATDPFQWTWDTKAGGIKDGTHTIKAVLFSPEAGAGDSVASTTEAESTVTVTVSNMITTAPSSVTLRYHYREGEELSYARSSKSVIVGGISETGISSDTTLSEVFSKHAWEVQDSTAADALVRNRTTSMRILTSGNEFTLGPDQLASSVYQEIDPLGLVHYETGATHDLDTYAGQGVVVANNLDLPELPTSPKSVGDTWITTGERIDVPGMPAAYQPRATLNNKLEDFEWQDGYPTAKIVQTFDRTLERPVTFGGIEISNPTVKWERDVYIAWRSGTLVRTAVTFTVAGQTTTDITTGGGQDSGGSGTGAPPGGPGAGGRRNFPGVAGGAGAGPSAGGRRFPGVAGGAGGNRGGSDFAAPGGRPPGGGPGGGAPGGAFGPGGPPPGPGGGAAPTPTKAITVRSTTVTDIVGNH